MKKFILIAASTAFLAACGEDKEEPMAAAVTNVNNQQQILTYIPADTPMLFTSGLNPEQYPDGYLNVMESQMDGAIKYMEVIMDEALDTMEEYTDRAKALDDINDESMESETEELVDEIESMVDEAETLADDVQNTPETNQKVRDFVNRWIKEDRFEKVGIKIGETQFAVYMVDLFPVVRIKLSEGHQVPAMLTDFEQQFDYQFKQSELDGNQIREIQVKNSTILISLDDDFLVMAAAPTAIKDQMVGQLIGTTKPAQTLAQDPSLIQNVKQAHGYVLDDLMVVDIQKMADYVINPAKHNSALLNFMQIEDNMLSPACKSEISALFAKAPRMVAGSKALTDDTINASFVWELNAELAADLATLTGRIPAGNPDAAMSMGMSFDLLSAKNLMSKYVEQVVNKPFACEYLAQMNQKATEFQAKLTQPIPPFVGNFKGFNFSLDELKLNQQAANVDNPSPKDMVESFKTQVYLAVDETQALLGMAQMMMPQLQDVEIKTDGSLITLADKVPMISGKDIPIDVANLYAAVSPDTIGFSMGHEGGGNLSDKVKEPSTSALMTFSADADGYKNLMEQIFSLAEMPNMPVSIKQELELQKELALGMLYWKTQDMHMSFTDQGFSTDINITY